MEAKIDLTVPATAYADDATSHTEAVTAHPEVTASCIDPVQHAWSP